MSYGKPGDFQQPGYTPQGYQQPGFPQAGPPKKSGGSTMIIVGVIVGVLALMCVGCGVIGVALLLPAVQAGRQAATQSVYRLNMQQIGMAMHNYHDTMNTLPPAYIPDENGAPRTSWRALLLPYLDQAGSGYNYNVAWNAPENASVIQRPIPQFMGLSEMSAGSTKTSFVAVTGTGTAFDGAQSVGFGRLVDGTANTILIVQIKNSDIDWAEPRDLDINAISTDPNAANSLDIAGGALVLMADGSVMELPRGLTLQELRDYLTIADGKVVPGLY